MTAAEPVPFREAVAAMSGATVRPEIELGPIRPPQPCHRAQQATDAEIQRSGPQASVHHFGEEGRPHLQDAIREPKLED